MKQTKGSIRTKLITTFILVSIVIVVIIGLVVDNIITQTLTENTGASLKNLANTQARIFGGVIARELEAIQILADNDTLQEEILLTFSYDTTDPELIQAQIEGREQLWQEVVSRDAESAFINARIENEGAEELLEFRRKFPAHVEVFITDRYGALVAATNRTSDYAQADEVWWQVAYNGGAGDIYIGEPEQDESSRTFGLNMAVPITEDESGEVIGVLRTTYRMTTFKGLLTDLQNEQRIQNAKTDLLINNRLFNLEQDTLEPLDPELLQQLNTAVNTTYTEMDFKGRDSFVSQRVIFDSLSSTRPISDLGWKVIIHIAQEQALAPVQAERFRIFIVAIFVIIGAGVVAFVMSQLLTGPIIRLTETAHLIASNNLAVTAPVESDDEIGELALAFNLMLERLQENVFHLEEKVSVRTRQLETVVEVSQRLSGILDLSDLMREVVTLVKETFDYYHVHIYLLTEAGDTLLMAEGYGQAGIEMKRQGHNIPLTAARSLVARAAREQRTIVVANTKSDPTWLPNPLLPKTKSEMAVPVILGAETVGVLDVQSERVGGLTQEDEVTLRAVANQVAIAVRNARLFAETQDALYEAQRLQQLYTGEAWQNLQALQSTTNYEVRDEALPPLLEISTPEAETALQQKQTVDMRLPSVAWGDDNGNTSPKEGSKQHSALAAPLKLRNQVIGVLGIHNDDPERRWTDEEIALIEAVGEQMSLAIENARLFEETGRRAGREKVIADVTQQVWSSGELEQVMQTAAKQLGTKLQASKVVVRLGTEDELLRPPKLLPGGDDNSE